MEDARERVAAACPLSEFKDDRHEWRLVMHDQKMTYHTASGYYALRLCEQCGLTVLLFESEGGYNDAPRKDDLVIFAFYPPNAPRTS
jgi:hypothetical protein